MQGPAVVLVRAVSQEFAWVSFLICLVSVLYIIHWCSCWCPLGNAVFISWSCNSVHKLATQQDQKVLR